MLARRLLDDTLNHKVYIPGAHSSDAPKESAVFCARTSINYLFTEINHAYYRTSSI